MSVKTTHQQTNTSYFVTFTCYKWLPLFDITNLYDDIYNWFDMLKKEQHHILGYVLMPNHLHVLIKLSQASKTINKLIAEGKMFRAYAIVKRLKDLKLNEILNQLSEGVSELEKKKGSKHKVFEVSFDCKECYTGEFIQQKLKYIHNNPVKAGLVKNAEDYNHSSAKFYLAGEHSIYPVMNYLKFYDVPIAR